MSEPNKLPVATKMPTAHQRLQISVKSLVHPKTITRCYEGKPVRFPTAQRICEAARALKLPEPIVVLAK